VHTTRNGSEYAESAFIFRHALLASPFDHSNKPLGSSRTEYLMASLASVHFQGLCLVELDSGPRSCNGVTKGPLD
jgi:hypothetical protein